MSVAAPGLAARARGQLLAWPLLMVTMGGWATNFVAVRAIGGEVGPFGLSFWRWALASLLLLAFGWRQIRRDLPAMLGHWRLMLLYGVVGIFVSNAATYLGLQTTTALNTSILQSTAPLLIVLCNALLFGERARGVQLLGVALSTLGVLVITAQGSLATLAALGFDRGDLFVLCGVSTYALYTTTLRLRPQVHLVSFLFVCFVLGTLCFVPCYAAELALHPAPLPGLRTLLLVGYIATIPTVAAHGAYYRAVQLIGAARAGQFTHLTPVFGVVLAMLLLGEQLHRFHLAGMALIAAGLVVAARRRKVEAS